MQAGSGIAEIVALEISRHEKKSVDEARKRIYLMDSKVIVVTYLPLHCYHKSFTFPKFAISPWVCGLKAKFSRHLLSLDLSFCEVKPPDWFPISLFSTSLIFNPHVYRDWLQRPGMNHCKNSRNHMRMSILHALLSFLLSRYATPGFLFMNFHISPFQDAFTWRHMKIFSTAIA